MAEQTQGSAEPRLAPGATLLGHCSGRRGWRLSAAYDLNPVPTGRGLSLNISEDDNALDLELAREVAPWFRVSQPRGRAILQGVVSAVQRWSTVAEAAGLGRSERERMATAFRAAH